MVTRLVIIIVLLIAVVFAGSQALFTIDEKEQVIITRFGEYMRTLKEPGLNFKTPFIEEVHTFEDRVLVSDAAPAEYLTSDKKRLVVDHVTRWRIIDPLEFYKSVRDVPAALARLEDLVFSEMRRELALHDFADIISIKRESIMDSVAIGAGDKALAYGIDVIDVRIKRADLPEEVETSVFARMDSERQRIAKAYRAEGDEQARMTRALADKEKTIILANAYEQSQILQGEGDAQAIAIYATAYGKDPEFYAFLRSLEAYQQFMSEGTTMVLTTDSDLFRYLHGSTP